MASTNASPRSRSSSFTFCFRGHLTRGSGQSRLPIISSYACACQMVKSLPSLSSAGVERWLEGLALKPIEVTPISGDVSARRYFRARFNQDVGIGTSAIVAVYPTELKAVCRLFRKTSRLLENQGIRVPRILADDCDRGFMLLEDLGPQTLFDQREEDWTVLEPQLVAARQIIDRLQALPMAAVEQLSPPLGAELLRSELEMTWRVYLEPQGLCGKAEESRRLANALDTLCLRLDEAEPVPSHRDFMARNLVPLRSASEPVLAVLDHQDLRLAPPAYDVASLCNDSLYPPPDVVDRILGPVEKESYHRASAQRTLKIVGTFVSFAHQGFDRYLELVGTTMTRFLYHFGRLPEGESLVSGLEARWIARLECDSF